MVHPLDPSIHKTAFSALYQKGGIPCRLVHGSVKHKLMWTQEPKNLNYNPLLVTFFEGLVETRHPYVFVVREGIIGLLSAPNADQKVIPLLKPLAIPLRSALCSKNTDTYLIALDCVSRLAKLTGSLMLPWLGLLLPPIASRVLASDSQTREKSNQVLATCEECIGPESLKLIRNRVPTYSSIHAT